MIKEIDVSKINDKTRYLDISKGYADTVALVGGYQGDRIVVNGASNKTLVFVNCTIISTRKESDKDALVFADELTNCTIMGDGLKLIYGGLTFWQKMINVTVSNVQIYYPNIGIRASQDFANKNVKIEKCDIVGAQREGIYYGPHTLQRDPSDGLVIAYNTVRFAGWDAIQFNAKNASVFGNVIDNPAILEEKDQWFGILAQIGSSGHVHENIFINAKRPTGYLDSRIFTYAKEL